MSEYQYIETNNRYLIYVFLGIMAFFFLLIVLPIVIVGGRVRENNERETQTAVAQAATDSLHATQTATLWTPTFTPTFTPTSTHTPTFTPTFTLTPSNTPTFTPTNTHTPTFTPTNTYTPTFTPTFTLTSTFTLTPTATPYVVGEVVITPFPPESVLYIIRSANVRMCPRQVTECEVIGFVPSGEEISVIGSAEGQNLLGSSLWYYFVLEAEDGPTEAFVHSSLVSEDEP